MLPDDLTVVEDPPDPMIGDAGGVGSGVHLHVRRLERNDPLAPNRRAVAGRTAVYVIDLNTGEVIPGVVVEP